MAISSKPSFSPRSSSDSPPPSTSEPKRTWTIEDRTYVLHLITLPSASGASSNPDLSEPISCLLNPALIPYLPNPLPFAIPFPVDPCFRIQETPNKGAGMFASRDIQPGELIVAEHPVLILPSGQFPDEVFEELGRALPPRRREVMMRMANCRRRGVGKGEKGEEWECKTEVEGIVRTNALVLELNDGGKKGKGKEEGRKEIYGGVYPFINRANHSCGANAAVKWNLASLSASLHALRPIRAGEEIFKTYINPVLPRSTRMATLFKNYRFKCDCPWCDIRQSLSANADSGSDEPPFTEEELARIEESDKRRASLGLWIFTHLGYKKWSTDLCREDDLIIKSHLEARALLELEGMQALQNLFIEEIAMAYATLGDVEAFKLWGGRLVQLSRVEDPDTARKFEALLGDPEKRVRKWAWRKRQREMMSKVKKGFELEPILGGGIFLDLFQVVD